MSAAGGLAGKLWQRYFHDFSLYNKYFSNHIDYSKYVVIRHNLMLVGGFYTLVLTTFPFKPAFPTMGLCPKGYEGTWVCEKDNEKALEMYKEWKEGKK